MDKDTEIKLLQQIDVLRGRLDRFIYYRDLASDERIISIGRRMDKLMNRYYKSIKESVENKEPRKKKQQKKVAKPKTVKTKQGKKISQPCLIPEKKLEFSQLINYSETDTIIQMYPLIIRKGEKKFILVKLFDEKMEWEMKIWQ
jgi:hypothetical protein